MSFIRNYSEAQQAERFDAEYFQPKYDEIVAAIKDYGGGWVNAENMLIFKDRNFNPKAEKEYQYVELANIGRNGEITGCTTAEGRELPTRARQQVSTGDVIVSSIEDSLSSIALITDEFHGGLC